MEHTVEEINKEIAYHIEAIVKLDVSDETCIEDFKYHSTLICILQQERKDIELKNREKYLESLEQKIAKLESKQIAAANTLEQIVEDSLLSEENNSLYLRIKEQVIDELRRK